MTLWLTFMHCLQGISLDLHSFLVAQVGEDIYKDKAMLPHGFMSSEFLQSCTLCAAYFAGVQRQVSSPYSSSCAAVTSYCCHPVPGAPACAVTAAVYTVAAFVPVDAAAAHDVALAVNVDQLYVKFRSWHHPPRLSTLCLAVIALDDC